jgi:acyl-CoA reductase-like NAD-dependent aldehyde dehydrogenase
METLVETEPTTAHPKPASSPVPARPVAKGQLFINGKWRDSADGKVFDTVNPTTEAVITQIAQGTVEDTQEAIRAARRAADEGPWRRMKASERAKIMHRIADTIEQYAGELAYREVVDMGKLYRDVTHVDIPHIANMFRYYAGWATKLDGSVKNPEGIGPQHLLAYTRREPLGVVAGITPYNFPMILSVSKIAPALAAGNSFIHKPASATPLTAITLAQIMAEAGVPEGVYNLVTGPGGTVGNALIESPLVDKIALTGSTETGIKLIEGSAKTMKHVTVELGGKSPNIVFADADLERAVNLTAMAIFWNKGEVCVAGSRCLVERSILDEFLTRLVARVEQLRVGDPFDPQTDMGPMAGKPEFEKVLRYIEIGKNEDKATLLTGGDTAPLHGKGYFVRPTVFLTHNQSRIAREEIFGPVLSVIPFQDFDEAIRLANDTPYGLASGVQTRDVAKAIRAAELIQAGTVWINTWHQYDPNAPFGGYKMSGYGREHGGESLEGYTQLKTIWTNLD